MAKGTQQSGPLFITTCLPHGVWVCPLHCRNTLPSGQTHTKQQGSPRLGAGELCSSQDTSEEGCCAYQAVGRNVFTFVLRKTASCFVFLNSKYKVILLRIVFEKQI